ACRRILPSVLRVVTGTGIRRSAFLLLSFAIIPLGLRSHALCRFVSRFGGCGCVVLAHACSPQCSWKASVMPVSSDQITHSSWILYPHAAQYSPCGQSRLVFCVAHFIVLRLRSLV